MHAPSPATGLARSEPATRDRARWRYLLPTWPALVATAVVVDLAMVAAYVHLSPGELGRSLAPSFPLSYKNWIMWAVFSPAVVVVVRAMLSGDWSWAKRAAASVALVATLAIAHALVELQLHSASGHIPTPAGSFLSYHVFHGLVTASVLCAVAVLIEYGRVAHVRELRELHLQKQVSRAQLDALRMQLQPHFLFNTLNSISALVEEDVRAGQRMISRLADFLRATLTSAGHEEVPLRDELKLLDAYVGIELIRFGESLRVQYDVAPDAADALVPNMILQPLVENAIRHGIQPSLAGGTITIRAFRQDDCLVVEVADDGVGLDSWGPPARGPGVGLANTDERLRRCYDGAALLEVRRGSPTGTVVVQRLPFTPAGGGG
jgi:two-component system LytT family sensor kinase